MTNETTKAIRQIIVFPARPVENQPGVAYGDVQYQGERFSIQYSRPRHPSNIGQLLDSGVAIHTDEGHDGNGDFANALGDAVDFGEVVAHIVFASRAESAIEESE